MPFLAPQLAAVGSYYDGRSPLPRRAERIAQLLADGSLTTAQVAQRCKVGERSVYRLKHHAAFRSRLIYLQELAAERAQAEEPLALKGNRIALAGQMVRRLKKDLEKNEYVTTLGVSKQGNPIVGFDRARVSEIRQYLSTIADELAEPASKQATDTLAVQVTMTTADAVTKVQALLSRAVDADAYKEGQPPMPLAPGVGGGISDADRLGKSGAVLEGEYNNIPTLKESGE